jgi:phosphoribosylanthranilate isomerase
LALSPFTNGVDVKVKICGITNTKDAQTAAEAGADAIGLMFYTASPRHISVKAAAEVVRNLPPTVLRTGVFVDPNPEDVFAAIMACGLNLLQFHGAETPEFCQQFGILTMKAFRIQNAESLASLPSFGTDAFLLDSHVPGKAGGTGETFNWNFAIEAKKIGRPIFLAGGLTANNVAEAVQTVQPYGVDVSSGVETSPGIKDPEKIRAFITAARFA